MPCVHSRSLANREIYLSLLHLPILWGQHIPQSSLLQTAHFGRNSIQPMLCAQPCTCTPIEHCKWCYGRYNAKPASYQVCRAWHYGKLPLACHKICWKECCKQQHYDISIISNLPHKKSKIQPWGNYRALYQRLIWLARLSTDWRHWTASSTSEYNALLIALPLFT